MNLTFTRTPSGIEVAYDDDTASFTAIADSPYVIEGEWKCTETYTSIWHGGTGELERDTTRVVGSWKILRANR